MSNFQAEEVSRNLGSASGSRTAAVGWSPDQLFPLSHPQRRIFFGESLRPGTPFANVTWLLRFPCGGLDEVSAALRLVSHSYPELHLRLHRSDGLPLQFWQPEPLELQPLEFRSEEELLAWCQAQAREPFILYDSPLIRFTPLALPDGRAGVLLKLHHLICDGWSSARLRSLLLQAVSQLSQGETPILQPSRWADHFQIEDDYLTSEEARRHLEFWLEQIDRLSNPSSLSLSEPASGYDTPELDWNELEDWRQERVEHWQALYEVTMAREPEDPRFHIAGWNSSFHDEPIPPAEMRCWVEDTVARIRSLGDFSDVLEIGCGTGLLLCRLAEHCRHYTGLDFSAVSLAHVKTLQLENVTLLQGTAQEVPDTPVDLVILNSIVQYFPTVSYLEEVLDKAIARVRPGGAVFLGDIRNLELLEHYQRAVVEARYPTLSEREKERRVAQRMAAEEELLLSPAFFVKLAERHPRLSGLRIWPKRGRYDNELSRYRYELVLYVEREVSPQAVTWTDFPGLDAWRAQAPLQPQEPLAWPKVPNGRLGPGLHPEELWELGAELSWAAAYDDGSFDVVFGGWALPPTRVQPGKKLHNNPLFGLAQARLGPELRELCAHKLPEYMVPTTVILLESFPLNANGKVDRKALPEPVLAREGSRSPRTPLEESLVEIWSEVLGVQGVGIDDNFFDLGGHSLSATQVVSRISRVLGVELPLRVMFEAPTIELLAAQLDTGNQARALYKLPRPELLPASFAQERLWFLDQLTPNNAFYNMPLALRLTGRLDKPALRAAFQALLQRHESLRTVFGKVDGQPVQTILSSPDLPWRELDVSSQQAASIFAEQAAQPFRLDRELPIRLTLLEHGPQEHTLILVLHHIVSDGWSMGVLPRDLISLLAGHALPALDFQYADFTLWQRDWLQGPVLEEQLSYWTGRLRGAPEQLALPLDFPRPSYPSHRGGLVTSLIPKQLEQSLRELSRRSGTTLFMTLLAAFAVLMRRYSGQDDLVIGSPVANRHHRELEGLIGFFVNTLALRFDLHQDLTFLELLEQTRQSCLDAYAHQDLPFERLVEVLNPVRDTSRNPLFQVLFALQNAPGQDFELEGLSTESLPLESLQVRLDLEFHLWEKSQGLELCVCYSRDLFCHQAIEQLAANYQILLCQLVAEPECSLASLSWPSGDGILAARVSDPPTPVLELLYRRATGTPDAIAAVCDGAHLSYGELARRSDDLAATLVSQGIRLDSRVGLAIPRSLEMLIAIYGILKAGAAYVPLDPDYPPERLAFIAEDSQLHLILDKLPQIQQELSWQPLANECPNRAAYVLYTSGSTGQPKGVVVTQANIAALAQQQPAAWNAVQKARVMQFTSLNFDVSVSEWLVALVSGGTLVMARTEHIAPGQPLVRTLTQERCSHLFMTPSALDVMGTWELPDLKTIIAAGEACRPSTLAAWNNEQRLLINGYGPTETNYATYALCQSFDSERLPIGKPWTYAGAYVLDSQLQPVPIGVPGELYIGGDGVAREYHRRPRLTAERFLPNPFSAAAGARMYKTGDRVRLLPDGQLDFLGRFDDQVKLRGFRIELGEIQAVLSSHLQVQEALALVRDSNLLAYVTTSATSAELANELKELCKRRLPKYMVPAAVVLLESFPLNANGKVDRKALPEPVLAREVSRSPRTPLEESLVEIWSEVLGVQGLGIDDNFFDLGGHSLSATQVVSRISRVLGVELPLRVMFEAPTIELLAAQLDTGNQARALYKLPRPELLPASFAQERLWFLDQLTPNNAFYNMPLALRLTGRLDKPALRAAFQALLQRHESLRTIFGKVDGQPVQTILSSPDLPWKELDVSSQQAASIFAEQAAQPFRLDRELPIRLTLLEHGPQEHTLILVLHHIVSDGWSLGVLPRDLISLLAGHALPALDFQYADFTLWQRDWLKDRLLEEQLSYWTGRLRGAPEQLALPLDFPRPSYPSHRGGLVTSLIPKQLEQSLRELSRRSGTTLFMTLLAAFAVLMRRYSGQDDLVIGSPVANRHHRELEGLIGFFVNTLALRFDLHQDLTFLELLEQTRQSCLEAYAHQDLPFERLVEELNPVRDTSRNPLVQVVFALQNAPSRDFEIPGLEVAGLPLEKAQVRMDLEYHLWETPQGLSCLVLYAEDLFAHESISCLVQNFQSLLEHLVAHPEQRLSSSGPAPHPSIHSLPRDTQHDPPGVLQILRERAQTTPDRIAAVYQERHLSYGQLEKLSDGVAVTLSSLGVGPESRVGLAMPRSLDLIIAIYSVMKAGAAYVPLDPAYPPERLEFLKNDARLDLVLEKLPAPSAGKPQVKIHPDSASYLIYTSGSTGLPKGAILRHGGLGHLARWMREGLEAREGTRQLQFASANFDASVFEWLTALVAGGTLVMASGENLRAGPPLEETLIRERCSHAVMPPSVWPLLKAEKLPDLRLAMTAGEACAPGQLRDLASATRTLVNGYGPTEATICATCAPCLDLETARLPIGRPWPFVGTYVLDENLHPLPIGVPGELYIGGEGVGRGYHDRPGLTAERFLPDPFSPRPGRRMYRTGDRVRQLPDGQLDFLGRLDDQIKLRGFRIEPAEIAAVLAGHSAVRQALVLVKDERLLGYACPRTDSVEIQQWRQERVERWQKLYDETIQGVPEDPRFHIVGWNSSFHDEPIPPAEMRCWVEDTVARIRSLGDFSDVLEIGCGTGLLLCRLAEHCRHYTGLDFSAVSLAHVKTLQLENVTLLQGTAQEVPDTPVDLVILNSIVQYFPTVSYLEEVLDKAIARVRPGGAVFLGDIRNLELLEHYQKAVVEARYPTLSEREKERRVAQRMAAEEELLLSPAFFVKLAERHPRLSGLRIWPKRGRYDNELSRYRYELVLYVEREVSPQAVTWTDFPGLDAWRAQAPLQPQEPLAWPKVPNGRLGPGLHPEELGELGAELSWAAAYDDGSFDVVFGGWALPPTRVQPGKKLHNNPLFGLAQARLGPELRELCAHKLPEYMVPTTVILLESFPLNANGKVDRKALPEPVLAREGSRSPRTPLEESLVEIWSEVLGVEGLGIDDNFFDLGGHSLSATQVVSRISRVLGVELPLRVVFEAPTIELLAAQLDTGNQARALYKLPRPELLPASFAQERLWFLDQLTPNNAFYNMPLALRLTGRLDKPALRAAFQALLQRHESLRTVFGKVDGQPVQTILSSPDLPWRELDVSSQQAASIFAEQAAQPFRLDRELPIRLTLLEHGPQEHTLILVLHHIVSDGWSMGVLPRDLISLLAGHALPALDFQYADFTLWQRDWLQGPVLEEQLSYWTGRLRGAPEQLALPLDFPRPSYPSHRGGLVTSLIPKQLEQSLRELSRRSGTTLFMTLLAAFAVLMRRYSGQDDLVIGSPVANRHHRELEGLIGFFVNTLALRFDLHQDLTFLELLEQTRQSCLEAYAHQDLPFERLVEELNPVRDTSRSPLVQVVFALQNAPSRDFEVPGLEVTGLALEKAQVRVDLEYHLLETPQGLSCLVLYAEDLFAHESISCLVQNFQSLLEHLVAHPEQRLSSSGPAPHPSIHSLPRDTQHDPPSVLQLLRERAQTTPDRMAAVYQERHLSYGQLEKLSDEVAVTLSSLGVGPESRVGLAMPRSLDLIIAIYSVMKAGAAYVPLDPAYPLERLEFLKNDARLDLVLEKLPAPSAGRPEVKVHPDSAAYLIYTSGSTGLPKGAILRHGGLGHLARWMREGLEAREETRQLQFASANFDASVFEWLTALVAGGTLVMASGENLRAGQPLEETLIRERCSHAVMPPSVWPLLKAEKLPDLRLAMTAGEACAPGQLRDLASATRTLVNGYGPTEATICATCAPCLDLETARLPIGRPWPFVGTYVLDENLHPLPIGVPGELYIGGEGVGRGYHDRPGLTAERFLPDPFSPRPGRRMYRTGDRVRQLPDGQLDFLGRLDDQIKLRGFRIEPAEIAAVLKSQANVQAVLVLVREQKLVAYAQTSSPSPELESSLRELCKQRLPEYMVPTAVVLLKSFPLNANGKVDRKALPEPVLAREGSRSPRTPLEESLVEIWSEVLGVQGVGIDDNFFDLGGHSLSATQVVSRISRVLGVELPLRVMFEAPTIELLAAQLDTGNQARALYKLPRPELLPASFAQERLWFLDQLTPNNAFYNMPLALRLTGRLDKPALRAAFQALLQRHESLRTIFGQVDGQPVQTILSSPDLPWKELDVSSQQAASIFAEQAAQPFRLDRELPIRLTLLEHGPQEHTLILVLHHIVSDGWSMGVLPRDLISLLAGHALPALDFQYADFTLWQRDWLQGPVLEEQLSYWTGRLRGAPEQLALPLDFPRPSYPSHRGGLVTSLIPKQLEQSLRELSRRSGTTLFMTLLAAFAVLMRRYSGQDDLVIGSPVANRHHRELEGLIGFFVNTLALRFDLHQDLTFLELLEQTRQSCLDAYAHQDLPFERLVEVLNPVRDTSRNPLFQVLFALQNAPGQDFELEGLSTESLPLESLQVRLDLEFHLWEKSQGLELCVCYSRDLFCHQAIEQLAANYQILLCQLVAEPECSLASLSWPSGDGILAARVSDPPTPVLELLYRRATGTPDAIAAVCDGAHLSYGELARRSDELAATLVSQGIRLDSRVGLAIPRSLEMLIAIYGILKAGAAYVPLDPDYPPERLAFIAEDSQLHLILDKLPQIQHELSWQPLANECPNRAAYVLYTSGSTGQPKGVVVTQANIAALAQQQPAAWNAVQKARVMQFTSLNFDVSVSEWLVALVSGGTLVMARTEHIAPGQPLVRTLTQERCSHLFMTPSALDVMGTWELPDLKTIIAAGEACRPSTLAAWNNEQRLLINGYGPTETNYATYALCQSFDSERLPIGKPWTYAGAYVLDSQLQPVPIGVPGELYIGGDGVAREYHRRPRLTAERFLPNPFSAAAGARMYKTGDRVRLLPDGQLDFLGRFDDQVKLRGFRIELGEIQAVLSSHLQVQEALALVRDSNLLAYVTTSATSAELANELKELCKRRLPKYMVPAAVVLLESFPLNANGKVDRKALPEPVLAREGSRSPRTPLEESLVEIWSEVLGVQGVGIDDNFFDLGGHSLSATQVVSRISRVLGVELPLRVMFEAPTIELLAAQLDTGNQARALYKLPRPELLPASFAQERLWFLDQLTPNNAFYNMPLALRLTGRLDKPALRAAFQALLQRHESLRTVFGKVDGQPVQTILSSPDLPWRELDVSSQQAASIFAEQAAQPFRLDRELPIRLTLLEHGPQEHTLILVLHHIVSDGWSLGVLPRDLISLLAGHALPALDFQYADFTLWQRDWLKDRLLEEQLSYWTGRLRGAPEQLALPPDFPRPSYPSHRGGLVTSLIPKQLEQSLRELSRRSGTTLFMTLLAAFAVLMRRYSGQDDLVIGSPVANRHHRELEGLIGFFVNTLALRFDLHQDLTFLELLEQTRQSCLEAYAHQDLPFERLVEELNPVRDTSRNPLVQVVFALQNAPSRDFEIPGLEVAGLPLEKAQVRMDLEYHLWETPQGLSCLVLYAEDLFAHESISCLVQNFQSLLEHLVAHPEQRLSSSGPALHPSVRPVTYDTKHDPPGVLQLLRERAQTTPDRIAAVYQERHLTYGQLEKLSDGVAVTLSSLGVGPESRVGLAMPRCLDLIIAIYSVMKAGAAYVPLDPAYPPERLEFLKNDARLDLVLEKLPAPSAGRPEVRLHTDSAAYLIYTSGSTGIPKGAVTCHRGLAHFASSLKDGFLTHDRMRQLQFASANFDASVLEWLTSLVAGGTLIMAPTEHLRAGDPLQATLERERCSHALLPPSVWPLLKAEPLSHLRVALSGGEACSPQQLRALASSSRVLLNAYGPTEATICATCAPCLDLETARLPIGRPWPFVGTYVLDENLHPLPIGVPGELYIGGEGVGRGYHDRPGLTAERFLPDPFSPRPGRRMYRTGDRVRQLPDGQLDFLGRLDDQIKLRGFRIEPAEIAAVLAGHSAVRQALVLVKDERLLGYACPRTDSVEIQQWRQERVERWQKLYDETIQGAPEDPRFHIVGWNSSFHDEPIPPAEMRCWVEDTVARIRSLGDFSDVLEIGCGTGLLLCRLAEHCRHYTGLDFSAVSLAHVKTLQLENVTLLQGTAQEVPDTPVDLVILNSIVQYFPTVSYLEEVLDKAIARVRPGGAVFLGDIRNLELLEHYQRAVVEARYPTLSEREKERRVAQRMAAEEELLLSPAFFVKLAERHPRISGLRIWPKRGRYDNELSRYRYELVLYVEREVSPQAVTWTDFPGLDAWRAQVPFQPQEPLAWPKVPNGRLGPGLHPEELWELGAELSWAAAYDDGSFDVVFGGWALPPTPVQPGKKLHNNPLFGLAQARLGSELRELCARKLPEYMVPAAVVLLESFPLNANGKVDRKALPEPVLAREGSRSPRTPLEESLVEIWSEVLGVEGLGIDDNFFDLGGHSLSATQVVSRISRVLGVELPLRALFDNPTVVGLARELGRLQDVALPPRPPIERQVGRTEAPISCYQEIFWGLLRLSPKSPMLNMHYALRLPGDLVAAHLEESFSEILSRHEVLRFTFHDWHQSPVQRPETSLPTPWQTIDLSTSPTSTQTAELRALSQAERLHPFDLSRELPVRARLVIISPQEHYLLFTVHHLVFDGWSFGILLDELRTIYRARLEGRPSPLPPLPVQYSDFAVWQRSYLTPSVRAAQLEAWRDYLRGASTWLDLPYDRPRPEHETFQGGAWVGAVSSSLNTRLSKLAAEVGVTPFVIMATGLALALRAVGDNEDFVIGFHRADRRYPPTERMLGLFVNSLALRCDLRGDPTLPELLQRMRRSMLQATTHMELPISDLRSLIVPEGSAPRPIILQVTLGFNNFPRGDDQGEPVMEVVTLEQEGDIHARIDLEVTISPSDENYSISLTYATDLFDHDSVASLGRTLEKALEGMVTAPTARLTELRDHLARVEELTLREPNGLSARLDSEAHTSPAERGI